MHKQAYDLGFQMALKDAGFTKLAMDQKMRHTLMTGAAGAFPLPLTGGITGANLAPKGQGGRGFWGPALGGAGGLVAAQSLAGLAGVHNPYALTLVNMLGKGLGAGAGYNLAVNE
jgi:hypothetical protein